MKNEPWVYVFFSSSTTWAILLLKGLSVFAGLDKVSTEIQELSRGVRTLYESSAFRINSKAQTKETKSYNSFSFLSWCFHTLLCKLFAPQLSLRSQTFNHWSLNTYLGWQLSFILQFIRNSTKQSAVEQQQQQTLRSGHVDNVCYFVHYSSFPYQV